MRPKVRPIETKNETNETIKTDLVLYTKGLTEDEKQIVLLMERESAITQKRIA